MKCSARAAPLRQRRAAPVGEETEILGRAQRRPTHEAQRLSRVHAFDECDFFATRLDQISHLVQDLAALLSRLRAPRRKRPLRGIGGRMHIALVTATT